MALTKGGADARSHRRFVPLDCSLSIKRDGMAGLFGANYARTILDLSEGGLSAVVSRTMPLRRRLRVELVLGPYRERFVATAVVVHATVSSTAGGGVVVGLRFLQRSPVMRVCIQSMLHRSMAGRPDFETLPVMA